MGRERRCGEVTVGKGTDIGGGVLYVKGAVGGTQGVGDPIGKGAEIWGAKEQ